MRMILTDHPFDNPNLKGFAGLPHEFSNPLPNIPDQYLVTILGHPDQMIFNLVNRVAPISIQDKNRNSMIKCGLS